jgi:hypothetical protein
MGDLSRIGFGGAPWGRGPAYPGLLGWFRPILFFEYPRREGAASQAAAGAARRCAGWSTAATADRS